MVGNTESTVRGAGEPQTTNMALHDGSDPAPAGQTATNEGSTIKDDLRKQRTGLRRQLGRLKGQLLKIRSDIDNLVAVDTPSDDEAYVELLRREKESEDRIEAFEVDLGTVQQRYDELFLTNRPSILAVNKDDDVKSDVMSYGSIKVDPRRLALGPATVSPLSSTDINTPKKRLSSETLGKMKFPSLTDPYRLRAHLSAFMRMTSEAGGGYIMRLSKCSPSDLGTVVLRKDCWRWCKSQQSWHSNRRELYGVLRALQAAADLVTSCKQLCNRKGIIFKVILLCDNKPSVNWLERSSAGAVSRSKALERRAISRLLSSCAEECQVIRTAILGSTVEVRHVQGSLNCEADSLSRVFERPCLRSDGTTTTLAASLLGGKDDPGHSTIAEVVKDGVNYIVDDLSYITMRDLDAHEAVMVADSVKALRCSIYKVDDTDKNSCVGRLSIAERLAANSWDYGVTRWRVDIIQKALRTWRTLCSKKRRVDLIASDGYSPEEGLIHSAQSLLAPLQRKALLRAGSAICVDKGLLYLELGRSSGHPFRQFYVPREAVNLRQLLLRDAHRRSGHGGREATLSFMDAFYLPGGCREARDVIFKCLPCRLNKATRGRLSGPQLGKNEEELLLNFPPYWSVDIDVLYLGEGHKVLVVVCRATGHCSMTRLSSEDGPGLLHALRRIQFMRGGLKWIYSDNASYFSSPKFRVALSVELGSELRLLASEAPWEAGRSNRIHGLGLTVLRPLLRSNRGRLPEDANEFDLILEFLMYTLNSRPLGRCYEDSFGHEYPLTPDLMVFGYERRVGPLKLARGKHPCLPLRDAVNFRKQYLREYWRQLRVKVLDAISRKASKVEARRWTPTLGEPVLVIRQRARKSDVGSALAHIDALLEGKRALVVFPSGRKQVESYGNLCPFMNIQSSLNEVNGPSKVGARIQVSILDTTGDRDLYDGTIRRDESVYIPPGSRCFVTWDDGSPPEWLDLSKEDWSYNDRPPQPAVHPRRSRRS